MESILVRHHISKNDVGICFLIETKKETCSNHLIHGLWAGADVKLWFALDLDMSS